MILNVLTDPRHYQTTFSLTLLFSNILATVTSMGDLPEVGFGNEECGSKYFLN